MTGDCRSIHRRKNRIRAGSPPLVASSSCRKPLLMWPESLPQEARHPYLAVVSAPDVCRIARRAVGTGSRAAPWRQRRPRAFTSRWGTSASRSLEYKERA